jgi:hypothetical protein
MAFPERPNMACSVPPHLVDMRPEYAGGYLVCIGGNVFGPALFYIDCNGSRETIPAKLRLSFAGSHQQVQKRIMIAHEDLICSILGKENFSG